MAVVIHTGDLKYRVVLKQPVVTINDEAGREISYPANTIETWASKKDVREYLTSEGNGTSILNIKEFFIRWTIDREAINKNWQLVHENQLYTIHEIESIDKKFIRISARTKE